MSVQPQELRFYGSANMSDGEGTTQGGAVQFSTKVSFSDISPNGLLDYLSDNAADTGCQIAASFRNASGTIVTENKTTNGTTIVNGTTTAERLEKIVVSGTAAVGNLAVVAHTKVITAHTCGGTTTAATGITPVLVHLQSGDGATVAVGNIIRFTNSQPNGVNGLIAEIINNTDYGTDIVAIGANSLNSALLPGGSTTYDVYQGMLCGGTGVAGYPNLITQVRRLFPSAAADVAGGSTRLYYEKIFSVNDDTTIDLTIASISKQSDPAQGTIDFALCNALNDSGSVANRQTAPASGITAFSSGAAPQSINVPNGSQNLPHGAAPNAAGAQGIWVRYTLLAGTPPAKGSISMRTLGSTT